MAGISFTGIGSGLAVNEIVEGLVAAESTPFNQRANVRGNELTTNISANGALKSALDAMLSSLQELQDEDNYALKSTSGGDDFVSITADEDSQIGSYDIQVNNLAEAQKTLTTTFEDDDLVGEGILSFATATDVADGNVGFTVDVSDTDTLSDVRDKINESEDNEDLVATIITDSDGAQRLVLTATETGADNAITITATAADGSALDASSRLNDITSANLTELNPAADASILIDGTITLTSSTNVFADAIDGVTLTAKDAHGVDDDTSTVSVAEDSNTVTNQLGAFVEAYNAFRGLADQLGAGGGEDENAGVLVGDALLRSVTSRIRSELGDTFGDSNLSLSQIGVELGERGAANGENYSIDRDTFGDAISDDPDSIKNFFIGTDDQPGFAASLEQFITAYTEDDGLIDSRVDGLNNQVDRLDERVADFALKIEALEARLLSQFNAMDALVSSLNSTGSFISSAFENLPGVVRNT